MATPSHPVRDASGAAQRTHRGHQPEPEAPHRGRPGHVQLQRRAQPGGRVEHHLHGERTVVALAAIL